MLEHLCPGALNAIALVSPKWLRSRNGRLGIGPLHLLRYQNARKYTAHTRVLKTRKRCHYEINSSELSRANKSFPFSDGSLNRKWLK